VAVTAGPGLIGALLVGLSTGKALAMAMDKAKINTNTLKKILTSNTSTSDNLKTDINIPGEINEPGYNKPANKEPQGKGQPTKSNPSQGTENKRRIRFEESSQAMYNLNYACLLLPRFPNHQMAGDLSMRLSEWLPQICIAYGWRLESISVQADHFQWIVSVSPTTAPGYLMRIIRKKLSEKIFEDFPRIRNENPSGDFWAPGYVLTGSSNPHPDHLVREFIEETRARQGIS
jgi:REP element-mobilizing transposase RayT